ncbi:hypothetical protein BH11PLA2_BH11PLA2_14390 [soil metagenome]
MVKAIYSNGVIRPVGPIPAEWTEGQSLRISLSESDDDHAEWSEFTIDDDMTPEEIDAEFAILNEMCSHNDPAEEEKMMQAIAEHRREQKELMRKEMGLS